MGNKFITETGGKGSLKTPSPHRRGLCLCQSKHDYWCIEYVCLIKKEKALPKTKNFREKHKPKMAELINKF